MADTSTIIQHALHQILVNGLKCYEGYSWEEAYNIFQQEAARPETVSITYRVIKGLQPGNLPITRPLLLNR